MEEIDDLPPIEVNRVNKVKEGIQIVTPTKLLTRRLVLLTQIKAGNNPCAIKKRNQQNSVPTLSTR